MKHLLGMDHNQTVGSNQLSAPALSPGAVQSLDNCSVLFGSTNYSVDQHKKDTLIPT